MSAAAAASKSGERMFSRDRPFFHPVILLTQPHTRRIGGTALVSASRVGAAMVTGKRVAKIALACYRRMVWTCPETNRHSLKSH